MKKLVLLTLVTMGLSMSAHANPSVKVFDQSVSGHGWCKIYYNEPTDGYLDLNCSGGSLGGCTSANSSGTRICHVDGKRNDFVGGGVDGAVNWLINNLGKSGRSSSSSNPAPANKFIGNAIEGSEYLSVCYATTNRISDIIASRGMKKEVATLKKIANLYKKAIYIELPKDGLNKTQIDFELQRRTKEASSLEMGSDAMTNLMLFCRKDSKFYKQALKVVNGKK